MIIQPKKYGQDSGAGQQKGGVGKTTTAINLAASLAVIGKENPAGRRRSAGECDLGAGTGYQSGQHIRLHHRERLGGRHHTAVSRDQKLDVLPSSINLVGAETELLGNRGRTETDESHSRTAQTQLRFYPDRLFAVAGPRDAQCPGRRRQRTDSGPMRIFRTGRTSASCSIRLK